MLSKISNSLSSNGLLTRSLNTVAALGLYPEYKARRPLVADTEICLTEICVGLWCPLTMFTTRIALLGLLGLLGLLELLELLDWVQCHTNRLVASQ